MHKQSRTYQAAGHIALLLVTASMILPLVLVFMSSITSESSLAKDGYSFWPQEFSLDAYRFIADNGATVFRAYGVTIAVTLVGTVVGVFLTSALAFALSVPELPGRRTLSFLVFFTLLFNGGLVPAYIMWSNLGVRNTLLAYVLPSLLLNAFNVILMRTYYQVSIPAELYEAAKLDGAGYLRIYFRIVLPLGKPILVTIGLFIALGYWNDWVNGLYYVNNPDMFSIQTLLNRMVQDIQAISNANTGSVVTTNVPAVSVRMAISFVALLPLLVVYPVLQRFFAKGIMVGAVKG
jgi:putative aldouronate transport system permease protein